MVFSEDSRVKIPCILHLVRLGYRYLSLKNAAWDEETNIFPDLFRAAIARINPDVENDDITRLLTDVKLLLDNEDLGKAFYEKLTERSGIRLIDFTDFSNNSFHVVTELTCKNGDDEFRPDITILINGMPLAFIEVKKPNNSEGVLAERNRIITRSRNPRFRRFINITQLMVFSNNMEYEDGSPQPIEGAFYASPSYDAPIFNYFREEETLNLEDLLADEDDALENEVLRDNNLNVIKHSPEFISNKSTDTPTNRICTSLFSRDRLSFLMQYALVYVNEADGLHKHVILKNAVEIFVKNSCNSILACICGKKCQLLRVCYESAGSKQKRGFQTTHATCSNLTCLERPLKPSRATIHMACSQFKWLQLRFLGLCVTRNSSPPRR